MFGPSRPDGSAARARLRSLSPRWTPTGADIDAVLQEAAPVPADAPEPTAAPRPGETEVGRHALPEAPRPIWRIDGAAARGLVSLALAAVVGGLVVVLLGWPRGAPVDRASGGEPAAPSPDAQSVLSEPSPATSTVVVDVDGKVRRPGVVELAEGSRVIDAIRKAGGLARRGDTGVLNLAEVLIDGQQIVVPAAGQSPTPGNVIPGSTPVDPAPSSGVGSTASVSINSASQVELETLPGIGPVLAAAILEWRTQNGGFTSIEQLQEVSGIGPATFAELAPLVRL
jgi:competence protein ComEA